MPSHHDEHKESREPVVAQSPLSSPFTVAQLENWANALGYTLTPLRFGPEKAAADAQVVLGGHASKGQPDEAGLNFMSLPIELRQLVYSHLLHGYVDRMYCPEPPTSVNKRKVWDLDDYTSALLDKNKYKFAICGVNSHIRREVYDFMLRTSNISLRATNPLASQIGNSAMLAAIRLNDFLKSTPELAGFRNIHELSFPDFSDASCPPFASSRAGIDRWYKQSIELILRCQNLRALTFNFTALQLSTFFGKGAVRSHRTVPAHEGLKPMGLNNFYHHYLLHELAHLDRIEQIRLDVCIDCICGESHVGEPWQTLGEFRDWLRRQYEGKGMVVEITICRYFQDTKSGGYVVKDLS